MSTYIASGLNTFKAGLNLSKIYQLKTAITEMLLKHFKLGDLFVTLTFTDQQKFNEVEHSRVLKKFYQTINRTVYGKAYDRGYKALRTASVVEYNHSDGIHIHMLLERPEPNDRFRGDFSEEVKSTWLTLNKGTVKKAQDVRAVFKDMGRVIKYMLKQMKSEDDLLRLDINNTKW